MSGVSNNIYNFTKYSLGIHSKALAKLQEQTSTGSRINRVSDSPSESYRLLNLESQHNTVKGQINNLSEMIGTLEMSSSVVNQMTTTFAGLTVNLNQVISGTYSETSRKELASQIEETLETVLSFANTRHQGRYVFGGGDTTSAPYVAEYSNGRISSVTYQGSSEERQVEIIAGVNTSAYYKGPDLFSSNNRSGVEFSGSTGAKAGTGTSNVVGDSWLSITGSAGNYELSIDGGVTKVTTDGTDTNLAVKDAKGNVLYVDTTGITAEGKEFVRAPGTYDIFNTLVSLRDLMLNEQNLSESQLADVRLEAMNSLQEIGDMLTSAQVRVGARIGFLDDINESLEDVGFNIEEEATLLSSADMTQVAIDLSYRELLYQMSLSVSANMLSTSLLDFLK